MPAIGQAQVGALVGESARDGLTDATGRSGEERDAALQLICHGFTRILHVLLRESEHAGWTNARRLGAHPHTDETPTNCDAIERLLERRLEPDRVERHLEHLATGDLGDIVP